MEWVLWNGKKILYSIFGGFLILFILSLWLLRSNSEASKGYFDALSDFQSFEKAVTTEKQAAALGQLSSVLNSYPDLHPLYDGKIAQTLINRHQTRPATPFATATLKRTHSDQLSAYEAYSQISLAIVENDFQLALQRSITLKQKLSLDKASEVNADLLFAFNLLRMPFLYQAMAASAEELAAWHTWKQYEGGQGEDHLSLDPQAFAMVASLFVDGKLSLNDYIDGRIKALEGSLLQNRQQKLQ